MQKVEDLHVLFEEIEREDNEKVMMKMKMIMIWGKKERKRNKIDKERNE